MKEKANSHLERANELEKEITQAKEELKKQEAQTREETQQAEGIEETPEQKAERLEKQKQQELKDKKKAAEEATIKREAEQKAKEAEMKAAIEAGKKSGATAARIAATKAAEGFINELTTKGKKIAPAVKKEIMEEAAKAGELAGSSSGADSAMKVAAQKMENKQEKKAEPAAVKLAAKVAKDKGSDLGKQAGQEEGHKAGEKAGLDAAKRIYELRAGNAAKLEAAKVGAQAGEATGAEEGALAGAQLGRDLAEQAADQAILQHKAFFDSQPQPVQVKMKAAAVAAARKVGVLKGREEGKKLGAEAGKQAGAKTGEHDAEKAETKVKESGRKKSVEKEVIIVAEAKAKMDSSTAGSEAGKAAVETVDKTKILLAMIDAAQQAMQDVIDGKKVPLFDKESAMHKEAFHREGMLAGENAGKMQGEKLAVQAAQTFLAAVVNRTGEMAKVLPKGCTLSKMRMKRIVELAGVTGKREGAMAGKKAAETALDKEMKLYQEDQKFTSGHVQHAVQISTVAATNAAMNTIKVGTKVATDEVKRDVEVCGGCPQGKDPDSDECL